MEQVKYQVYGYRWIVLLVYAFIQAVMQMLWITFAPITGDAAAFYQVTVYIKDPYSVSKRHP